MKETNYDAALRHKAVKANKITTEENRHFHYRIAVDFWQRFCRLGRELGRKYCICGKDNGISANTQSLIFRAIPFGQLSHDTDKREFDSHHWLHEKPRQH
jgi:hypothetical protein